MATIFGSFGNISDYDKINFITKNTKNKTDKINIFSEKGIHFNISNSKNDVNFISNKDRSIIVIFDGELYNKEIIIDYLKLKDYRIPNSDVDSILKLYENKKHDFVELLDGEFIFIIIDKKRKKIILGRDYLGIKTLYYLVLGKEILFSTECKTLISYLKSKKVNRQSLHYFLSYKCMIPGEDTLIEEIKRVPPATLVTWDYNKTIKLRYWNPPDIEYKKIRAKDIQDRLFYLYEKYVKDFYVENKTGICLSGGIDSSALAAITNRISKKDVKTFSIGYEKNDGFDDQNQARIVSEYLGTKHFEKIVNSELIKHTPNLIWYADDLSSSSHNSIIKYMLPLIAKQKGCNRILEPYGSEQVFGEIRDELIYWNSRISLFFDFLKEKDFLVEEWDKFNQLEKFRILMPHNKNVFKAYRILTTYFFSEKDLKLIYNDQFRRKVEDFDSTTPLKILLPSNFYNLNDYYKGTYLNLNSLLQFFVSRDKRIATSLDMELKFPLLRKDIIEYSFKIHPKYKFILNKPKTFLNIFDKDKFHEKYILRKIMRGKLPKKVCNIKEHSSVPPIRVWVNEQRDLINSIVKDFSKRDYIKENYIKKILYKKDWSKLECWRLWGFFVLEVWHKTFIDQKDIKKIKF